jgi:hypothetical protein
LALCSRLLLLLLLLLLLGSPAAAAPTEHGPVSRVSKPLQVLVHTAPVLAGLAIRGHMILAPHLARQLLDHGDPSWRQPARVVHTGAHTTPGKQPRLLCCSGRLLLLLVLLLVVFLLF